MDTSQRLSQAVSIIPLIVTILVLYIGGSLGTWFIVEEFYQYSATDEDARCLSVWDADRPGIGDFGARHP